MVEVRTDQMSVTATDGAVLVQPTNLVLHGGTLVALVGPNGAGKSSLVRALAGIARYTGSAQIDGDEIAGMTPLARARRIAWLPQSLPPAWPVTVRDAVALGRFAFGATPGRLAPDDAAAVERALIGCDIASLADRRITTLSGGELARVHLARTLSADAEVLLTDEPAAALDLAHQLELMQLLKAEAAKGRVVLVVVHDIALAALWADHVIAMAGGRVVTQGAPADIITQRFMADVFGVTAVIETRDGRPTVDITGPAAAAAD